MKSVRLGVLLACLGAVVESLPVAFGDTNAPVKQGAALMKTDLLGVFAHPDDETGAGAVVAQYALGQGKVVAHVYCTRGEGGGNMVGTQAGTALGHLREAELRDSLKEVGVRYCYFLGQSDFGYTESLSATFERWDHTETLRRLVRLIRTLRPEVILTMNPAPTMGQHGHHQAAAVLATEAFDAAADSNQFPELISKEGLYPWQVRKLYYPGAIAVGAAIRLDKPLPDGRFPADAAADAMARHQSQAFGNPKHPGALKSPQSWALVKSVVPIEAETDFFRGLPVEDSAAHRVLAPGDGVPEAPISLRFRANADTERYWQFVRREKIEHAATTMIAQIPVVAGEPSEVPILLGNSTTNGVSSLLKFVLTKNWEDKTDSHILFSPMTTNLLTTLVSVPAGLPHTENMWVKTEYKGQVLESKARLEPVPRVVVKKLAADPVMDANDADTLWATLAANSIDSTRVWQGKVRDAADCSGSFRIGHRNQMLYVEVRVVDDVVVSNIEPNDIRGHWRSDSVEICLDPAIGALHTFGCYKLGIFPFDTTGRVRAARDADANPGPVEETAPGTRLVSWKTTNGYAIRLAIPFAEIGLKPEEEPRFGFNVLIYDGDKADAAQGENINKSRLAWSPTSGVQGRPLNWGRADLE
ncbi:MAG TPA: PIG-L family deacetylase [Candidatus Limnocylindria bacterium]|nr:PIG-L family deacetylase [Candidatus Limnocylindria bacterium]